MSRIGKKPISIPEGVDVKVEGGETVVKGPKGELRQRFSSDIKVEVQKGKILIYPDTKTSGIKARWGLVRMLAFNMVKGVTEGYEKKLELEGFGYRVKVEGDKLVLQVGFTHPVEIKAPEGIKFSVEKNIIIVTGIDKAKVGEIAAKIKAVRRPDPYKGKGIKYFGEKIRRKVAKKVTAAAT